MMIMQVVSNVSYRNERLRLHTTSEGADDSEEDLVGGTNSIPIYYRSTV
jgi:hypothetical protein